MKAGGWPLLPRLRSEPAVGTRHLSIPRPCSSCPAFTLAVAEATWSSDRSRPRPHFVSRVQSFVQEVGHRCHSQTGCARWRLSDSDIKFAALMGIPIPSSVVRTLFSLNAKHLTSDSLCSSFRVSPPPHRRSLHSNFTLPSLSFALLLILFLCVLADPLGYHSLHAAGEL